MKITKSQLIESGFYHPKMAKPEHRYKGADLIETHNQDVLEFRLEGIGSWVSLEAKDYENGIELSDLIMKIDEKCKRVIDFNY